MSARTDPRVTRTVAALRQAVVDLASERPVSQITVADLTRHAGLTRATFYNHYATVLDPLAEALHADLDDAHRREEQRRAAGRPGPELLRLAVREVADHVERYADLYRHALDDPADHGVYDTLVQHFDDYAIAYLTRAAATGATGLPRTGHPVAAQFLAHGFTGAIRTWLRDPGVTREDLVDAVVACAPPWWADAGENAPGAAAAPPAGHAPL